MQEYVYKIAIYKTSDLKQRLIDTCTNTSHNSINEAIIFILYYIIFLTGESGHVHVRKWKIITLNIC